MPPRYSAGVTAGQPLPAVWLISDARNDAALEHALARLPAGSGFVFRHYHLGEDARRQRFEALRDAAHRAGHLAILAGEADRARAWDADGVYGAAEGLAMAPGLLRLATAHNAAEIAAAGRAGADGVFLSPVFATRSHPGSPALGPEQFRALAALSEIPVIALGGMTAERARAIGWPRWGAIDAFAPGDS